MSKGEDYSGEILAHTLQGIAMPAPSAQLYVSLHTADPTPAGDQSSNECAYTGYARQVINPSNTVFQVAGRVASLLVNVQFPKATGGSEIATHAAIGVASTGAGAIKYSGPLTPTITIAANVIPQLDSGSTVTEN